MSGTSLRDDRGFTLIELMVAIVLSFAALAATLSLLDNSTKATSAATALNDASDQLRTTMDATVRSMRSAFVLESAQPGDVVFRTAPSATTHTRLCVDATGQLRRSVLASVPSAGSACTGGAIIGRSVNANPFTYAPTTAATVSAYRSVGIALTVDAAASGAAKARSTTLTSSVVLRGRQESTPVFDASNVVLAQACDSSTATYKLTTTSDELGPLTLSFTTRDTNQPIGTPNAIGVSLPRNAGVVNAVVTNALGSSSSVAKVVEC